MGLRAAFQLRPIWNVITRYSCTVYLCHTSNASLLPYRICCVPTDEWLACRNASFRWRVFISGLLAPLPRLLNVQLTKGTLNKLLYWHHAQGSALAQVHYRLIIGWHDRSITQQCAAIHYQLEWGLKIPRPVIRTWQEAHNVWWQCGN